MADPSVCNRDSRWKSQVSAGRWPADRMALVRPDYLPFTLLTLFSLQPRPLPPPRHPPPPPLPRFLSCSSSMESTFFLTYWIFQLSKQHIRTHTHTRMHIHLHARAQTHTHTNAYTHMRARTQTIYIFSLSLSLSLSLSPPPPLSVSLSNSSRVTASHFFESRRSNTAPNKHSACFHSQTGTDGLGTL